jgi:hypothetical protein
LTACFTKNIEATSKRLFKIEGHSLSLAEIISEFYPGGLSILTKAPAFDPLSPPQRRSPRL